MGLIESFGEIITDITPAFVGFTVHIPQAFTEINEGSDLGY